MSDALIIDDLLKVNTHQVREMKRALNLLEVLPHAVENDRRDVVNEYIERVTRHIQRALEPTTEGPSPSESERER